MNITCPINSSIKLHFITDVHNGYFSRNVGQGIRQYSHQNMVTSQILRNGRDTIEITPSKSNVQLKEGQIIPFTVIILHRKEKIFKKTVEIKITSPIVLPPPITTTTKKTKKTKKKRGKKGYFLEPDEHGTGTERLDPPKLRIIAYSKGTNLKKWTQHFGDGNEKKGAVFFQRGKQITAIVNLSHQTLIDTQDKAKGNPKRDAKRHTHAVGVIPWALHLIQETKDRNYFEIQDDQDRRYELTDFMEMVADAIAYFGVDFIDRIRRT